VLTITGYLLLELDLCIEVDSGMSTSCWIVGGVAMDGEGVVVALEPTGAEAPADDVEEVVEADPMECLFVSMAIGFTTLASPGLWWLATNAAPGAVV
jgi:hypothetical protein